MCGRVEAYVPSEEYLRITGKPFTNPYAGKNVAPTDSVPIVVLANGEREVRLARWGFETAQGSKVLFNARSETVSDKPSFSNAFRSSRCLVPVSGWYEWMFTGKKKVPFVIRRKDHRPAVLAGLWRRNTFTLLTCEPSSDLAILHDRMPVVLLQKHWQVWLDPQTPIQTLIPLLVPFPGRVWDMDEADLGHKPKPKNLTPEIEEDFLPVMVRKSLAK